MTGFGSKRLTQLIAQICLARLLTPEDFGLWGMVLVITHLSDLFKDSTVAGVLVQRGLDNKPLVNGVYSICVNISVVLFFLQTALGFIASFFFGESLLFPLATCVSLKFLISAGTGAHAAVLQRQMKFRELAISSACTSFTRYGGSISLALLGFGVWSFAVAGLLAGFVSRLTKSWFSKYAFQYRLFPDRAVLDDVGGFITSLVGTNLAVYANTNSDDIIVGRMLGVKELGFYSLAYQIAMLPMFALSQINRVNYSVISQKDARKQYQYVRKMLELCAVLSAPTYALAFIVSPWLIPLVYGDEWQPIVPLFRIIIIFAYSRGFMSILGTALNALDYPQINAIINWVLTPISLGAFILGALLGGLQGVSIAVALVMGVLATLWMWIATCRVAKWNIWDLSKVVVVPTLCALLMLALAIAIPLENGWVKLVLQPVIIVFGYFLSIIIFSKGKYLSNLIYLFQKIIRKIW